MANILKVLQAGHPSLRQPARALTQAEVRSAEVQRLIEDMRETMRDAPGVGLAAPQIGRSLQLVVIEDQPETIGRMDPEDVRARGRTAVPFQVLVNPRLTIVDRAPVEFFEGCLSFADFMMVVPRAAGVRVQALDHNGAPVSLSHGGWPARILQHEIDHLHGVLCVDRMHTRTLTSIRNHSYYWQGEAIADILKAVGNTPETDAPLLPPIVGATDEPAQSQD